MRTLTRLLIVVALLGAVPATASADDKSFSSIVKHLKSNYRAKGRSTFGFINLARFAVKLVKPAGVKNFKVSMLHSLDFSENPNPDSPEFHNFIRNIVHSDWRPLVQYNGRNRQQWSYIYVMEEKENVKVLAVSVQQHEAFVVQFKFSPERLIAFINDPKIMGISLKGTSTQENTVEPPPDTAATSADKPADEKDKPQADKQPAEKPATEKPPAA